MSNSANSNPFFNLTGSYFSNLIINSFNKQFSKELIASNYNIFPIPNDQNSDYAFGFFPASDISEFRIRVYCSIGSSYTLSRFNLVTTSEDYSSTDVQLKWNNYIYNATLSFGNNIIQTAPFVNKVFRAHMFIDGNNLSLAKAQGYDLDYSLYNNNGLSVLAGLSNPYLFVDDNGNAMLLT